MIIFYYYIINKAIVISISISFLEILSSKAKKKEGKRKYSRK